MARVVHPDRDLLQALYNLMKDCDFVLGDQNVCRDMAQRYSQPPLTLHKRAVMQLTVNQYYALGELLKKIDRHLGATPDESAFELVRDRPDRDAGDLPLDADAQQ